MHTEAISGMWRSESMTKFDLLMPRENAHTVLTAVGMAGVAHFVDLNGSEVAFNRPHTGEIRRCEDIERRLRYFSNQMTEMGIVPQPISEHPRINPEALRELEELLESRELELRDFNNSIELLTLELNSHREVFEVASRDLACAGYQRVSNQPPEELNAALRNASAAGTGLVIAGVIPQSHQDQLSRIIFRASRGKALIRLDPVVDPFYDSRGEPTKKSVFVIFAPTAMLKDRLSRLVDTAGGSRIDVDRALAASAGQLATSMNQVRSTLSQTRSQKKRTLQIFGATFKSWVATVQAEKELLTTMNMMRVAGPTTTQAQVWVSSTDIDKFHEAVSRGAVEGRDSVAPVVRESTHQIRPPTHFRTNKFTSVFQGIVNSYGIAQYKEANPGVFTIITFPYLFGIMYGDIGHGALLTIFAALLVTFETKLERATLNEIVRMIFGGRYLLLLMGLFATYIGILYNDFFGFSVGLFASGYHWPSLPPEGPTGQFSPATPNGRPNVKPLDGPTVFGIDVSWAETENKLEFYNSTKMKCAIIVGVIQMLFGLILSLTNHLRFGHLRKVLFLFVPEITFLMCTFGYMAIIIVVKWCISWDNTYLAPSLLETMTNFFLMPGTVSTELFHGQAGLQVFILLVAFSMVPVMLVVIPFLEHRDHKRELADPRAVDPDNPPEPFDLGAIIIHYVIHTIEFVLGCVSNTASYLRLWALSLAHAQLSEVFLNFAFAKTLELDQGSGVVMMIGFSVWLGATIGVLLMMESLSAFLHALRLHWVEFQNKFYSGDGWAFQPLDLKKVMEKSERD